MLKKMLFLVITIFFIFVGSTQATRINYKYDGGGVVKGTMFVYYPGVYKVVDNYGKVYKTYVWNGNPDHKEDRTVSFTADISDCKSHRFRLTYSGENEGAGKCLTDERTWHHFWKNPGCSGCFPMDNPWIKAPEYDCKKQFECPYPTKHDKPEFGEIANCHKVNFSTGVGYHCDFYSGLRDDFVPKSDNSGCYWRGKTNPICGTSVNSCKKGTFIDIADTYSLNKWVCRNGNSDTVCVKFKESPKCSGTKPSGEGIIVGTSSGKGTWSYVNSTPGACQWTCQNGYEKQGNSCVKIPADDSCNSSIFSGVDTSGCNKCIVGGTVYKGEKISYLAHYFANPGSTNVISYTNDFSYDFKTLQEATSWSHSNGTLFKYADGFTWNNGKYHIFKPGYKEKVMELAPGKGFSLYDVREGANRNKFAFMVGFTDTYRSQIAVKPDPKYFPLFKVDVDKKKFGDYHGHTKYSPEFIFLYAKYKLGIDLTGKYSDYRADKGYMVLWTEENNCIKMFFEDLDKFIPPTTIGEAKKNRECVFYKPAFCGDGVVDSDKGEECDPKANNNLPNGKTCSSTCKIVSKPVTCTGIKVDPTSGNAPLDANITCSGNNVTKGFKLAIIDKQGNLVNKNRNGNSFDYTFSKEGKYTLKCYADKQVTSDSCTTEVQVGEPKKADIELIKEDLNLDDVDGKIGNDTQTIQIKNKSVFKITVKNTGNVSLENVRITDKLAPNCSGLFGLSSGGIGTPTTWLSKTFSMKNTNATFDPGETFSYVCISDKVANDYTNTAKVTADPVDDNLGPVSDEDDSKVVVLKPKRCDVMNVSQSLIDITGKNGGKVDVVCKGEDVKNYKILCGNGDVINSDKGTCIYEKPGNYNVVCQMDGLSGENCKKDVEIVKKTAPAIKIEKYSGNPDDLDGNKDHNEADDSQTVSKGSKAVFKIKVTNIGGEVLKDVKVTDAMASACNNTIGELAINESRIYTCEKGDTQGNYTNVAKVEAKGKDSNKLVDDEDDTEVNLEGPAIKIEKYSGNPNDLDGYKTHTEVDDSQTVAKGSKAVFTIKVTNIGTEVLKDVKVTDALAPNCNNTFSVELKPNETKTYTCEKTDTQKDYTNTAEVTAKGKNSNKNVNDEDKTEVKILKPAIKIEKYSGNENDLDGNKDHNEADDSQTVAKGSKAVFAIKVTNIGSETLKNIVVTDTGATDCSHTLTGELAPNEFKTYTCEKANTQNNYTNTAEVTAKGKNSGDEVKDSDTTKVKLPLPKIQIEKYSGNENDLDGNKDHNEADDSQTVKKGDKAVFEIKVTNIGSETLKNIVVTDTGATDCSHTLTGELAPNEFKTYTCEKANTQNNYTNTAEVTAKGKNSGDEVKDSDTTNIIVDGNHPPLTLRCTEETVSVTTVKVGDEVEVTCKTNAELISGIDEVEYKIDCGEHSEKYITGTGTANSTFIGKCKYTSKADTEIQCLVKKPGSSSWKEPGSACTKSINITSSGPDPDPDPDGSSLSVKCTKADKINGRIEVRCEGDYKDLENIHYKVDCGNGETVYMTGGVTKALCGLSGEQEQHITCYADYLGHYNFRKKDECNIVDGTKVKAKCGDGSVDKGETCDYGNADSSYWIANGCTPPGNSGECTGTGQTNSYCGDGIKGERTDGGFDQCDPGPELLSEGNWPNSCGKPGERDSEGNLIECKLKFITIPAGGDLVIEYPEINKIVGTGVGVFTNRLLGNAGKRVCLVNKGERTLAFEPNEQLVLISKRVNGLQVLDSKIEKEVNITNLINNPNNFLQPISYDPNAKICFTYNRNSTTTTENLGTNDFGDVKVIATIHNGEYDDDLDGAYFARISNIRVARPGIVTTGGGDASYNTSTGTSDIHNVTGTDYNIVGANAGNTSSYTSTGGATNPTTGNSVSVDTTGYGNSWENYNGLDNVYIYKGNTTINGNTSVISGISNPTTLIVEGDLTIDGNIEPSKNIAVIVKNGNLTITSNVTTLKGTYIVINGKITGEENNTNQLVIKGSLYGDVNDLISKRTYVDGTAGGDTLDVGTILDFNSSVYEDQAPLLSKFLDEYFQASRTAN